MRLALLAAAAAVSMLATTAHADQRFDPEPLPAPQLQPQEAIHDKSPELAVGMSIGVTLAGYVAMAEGANQDNAKLSVVGFGAVFFGPSLGQWYAGKTGGLGIAARGVGLTMMVYGISQLVSASCADCARPNDVSTDQRAKLYLGTGAALWVGSTIYDIVVGYRETDRFNRRQHATFAPTMIPAYNGTQAPGMTFATTF